MKNLFKMVILLFLCLCATDVFAAQWGALLDYTMTSENEDALQAPAGRRYLLNSILAGEPLYIWLDLGHLSEEKRPEYEKLIASEYARWFAYPAQLIRKAGREEEFADVLPVLDRGIHVQFVQEEREAEIGFYIFSAKQVGEICGDPAVGCYIKRENEIPRIFVPSNQFIPQALSFGKRSARYIALHEIGHSLGLSDQYKQSRNKNSHMIYSTQETSKSAMNSNLRLTCDDADGMINLIDISRGTSRGGEFGWRSLCAKSDVYYIQGMPAGKAPYNMVALDNGYTWKLQRYENGRIVSDRTVKLDLQSNISPFDKIEGTTVLEKDGSGRPVHMRGVNGEDIYYGYNYERYQRMVFMGDKLLRVEIKGKVYTGKGQSNEQEVLLYVFGEGGKLSQLEYTRPIKRKGKTGRVVYQKDVRGNVPAEVIAMDFNAKGDIITRHLYSNGKLRTQKRKKGLVQSIGQQITDQKMKQMTKWYFAAF